ncbi:MAG: DsbA family protein [bacterium]|nr:DsbA family protein [bacterium]
MLEYSELFCPYCRRQHNNGVIDAVLNNYKGEVNASFRNFIVHPGAKKYAEAAECVADIKGEKAYNEFIDKAFHLDSAINDQSMETILKEIGVSSKKVNACIDKGTFADRVDTETTEGRTLFGVKGTPGNVIIDRETGEFILIPGAYPKEKFIEEIDKLMK